MSTPSLARYIFPLSLALSAATVAQAQTAAPAPATCQVITSVPTEITAPGVYCLTEDLTTTTSSGIAVNANDVVIDCNHHKLETLGGPAAGGGVLSFNGNSRITVRRCTIRGFRGGVEIGGGSGHIVEDNLMEGNKKFGIEIGGGNQPSSGALIRRNRVLNTGATFSIAHGISVTGNNSQVLDNRVATVFSTSSNSSTSGIVLSGGGHIARGNTVVDIAGNSGIFGGHVVRDNTVVNEVRRGGTGISSPSAICRGNDVVGFDTGVSCAGGISSGNLVVP
jgi:hypothetical protein